VVAFFSDEDVLCNVGLSTEKSHLSLWLQDNVPAPKALVNGAAGIAVDGDTVSFCDKANNRIRQMRPLTPPKSSSAVGGSITYSFSSECLTVSHALLTVASLLLC
jgi:hypothetical protein